MKKPLLFLILFFYSYLTFAAGISTVRGLVIDKRTGEPLIGATITLKSKNKTSVSTAAGLDGSFVLRNVEAGDYEMEIKYVSYQKTEVHFSLKESESRSFKIELETTAGSLGEVNIQSKADGGSDQSTIRTVQRADQIMNAVSAKTIEVSPDITVANVMQRISGVSIERSNNGEGQYAIIRGMDKRYTYTLINGYKIPSPDNKNRYVPLDIFPADIIERLEVYKSLIPSMEGDAIAGGVNLVLKDAPDEFTVRANVGATLSQSAADYGYTTFGNNNISPRAPRIVNGDNYVATLGDLSNNPQHFTTKSFPPGYIGNLSIGGRTADKKFGALLSLSTQDVVKDTKGVFFTTSTVDAATNLPNPTDIQSRFYSTEQKRTSVIGRFDYKFDNRNKIILDASYIDLAQNQYRYVSDTSLNIQRTAIGQGRVTEQPRSIRNVQKIYDFSLHGDHELSDNLSFNWTGIYAKATSNEDRYTLNLVTSDILQPSGAILHLPLSIDASNGYNQQFGYNSDQDKSGYLNFIYTPKVWGTKVEFSAGGMYRNKARSSTFDTYLETLPTVGTTPTNGSTQIYDGNIDHNVFVLTQNQQGTPGDALNYDFTENVGAAYLQFKFTLGKLQTLGGVRYEHTSQNWLDAEPVTLDGKTGSIKYYDFLPTLDFKYMLSDKENLRATYNSSISRPNFYELIPHTSGDPDADYQEVGNPFLKHATANNYDLRYEFFPKALDQFLAGVFYKSITNPIEYALTQTSTSKDLVLEAGNFGNAHNYGLELDATKYFNQFGIRGNYSFTQSAITTTKEEAYKDASKNSSIRTVDQTRPLQGQSKNLGNLSLLYKDSKIGLDAQISAVYTGERINSVSIYLNNDVWQKSAVTMDVSAEKRLFKQLYIYAKATNLLNTPYQLFIKEPYPALGPPGSSGQAIEYQEAGKNTFVRKDTYEAYYILGLHYKL